MRATDGFSAERNVLNIIKEIVTTAK
jgi:hypothetical protein